MNLLRRSLRGKWLLIRLIAKKLGTKAFRAVGNALKRNQKPIIIPCHRVVKSDCSIGGYCGRINSNKKVMLLREEGIIVKNNKVLDLKKVLFKF